MREVLLTCNAKEAKRGTSNQTCRDHSVFFLSYPHLQKGLKHCLLCVQYGHCEQPEILQEFTLMYFYQYERDLSILNHGCEGLIEPVTKQVKELDKSIIF